MSAHPLTASFGVILCSPNSKLQKALDAAIAAVSELKVMGDRNSQSADRTIYFPTQGRIIVNTPAPHMFKGLGQHSMVCAFTVDGNPPNAADKFGETIREHGFEVTVHHGLEPELPIASFVTIDEMPHVAFMMWPQMPPVNLPPVVPKN